MDTVIVLGGCGVVGSVAVKTLAKRGGFSEIVIGDANTKKAKELVKELKPAKVSAVEVNAEDAKSVKAAIKGCDVVLNCVGPFYRSVKTVLGAVIDAKIDYLDICDDVDVTLDILKMNGKAKKAGIKAVIGMGASPGVTNLLAKFVSDTLLDETDSIDIYHTHGGEPSEGAGVIGHRFHCMSIDIPMFLDGKLKYVKFFEKDGIALRENFNFPVVGTIPVFPYPHPEQVTLPKYIKTKQVTNKGSVLPIEYYNLIGTLCQAGLANKEPLQVKGREITPHDFAIAYIIREREKILKKTKFGKQKGAMSIVVKGKKDGQPLEYRLHSASGSRALGEGTGIPAALGVMLMKQGKITSKGVLPPEGCVNPLEFIALAKQLGGYEKEKEGGLFMEMVDAAGAVTRLEL